MSNENEVTLQNTENEMTEATAPVAAAAEETKESKPSKRITTMDDVLASTSFGVKEGMRVKVKVLSSDETGVYVSGLKLGKKDGFIAVDRLTDGEYKPE